MGRYHITPSEAQNRRVRAGRLEIERSEACINCGHCIRACVYDVHARRKDDPRLMAEPRSENCHACFRCVTECPVEAIHVKPSPLYAGSIRHVRGEDVATLLFEASTGRVPVSGAGYGGPFAGDGFDGIWTDMSEIVRPTRDGIHGREYISTTVQLGRRPRSVLDEEAPMLIDIPFPVIFGKMPSDERIQQCVLEAASQLGTLVIVAPTTLQSFSTYAPWMVPHLNSVEAIDGVNIVELDAQLVLDEGVPEGVVTMARLAPHGTMELSERVLELMDAGAHVVHLVGDDAGMVGDVHITDVLRTVHRHLIEVGARERISVVAEGGIALAEHVPKCLLCGADAVVIDTAYLIALEYLLPDQPPSSSHVEMEWGVARIRNLMCSWRDQLLEVAGAMGIKDVRRMRGEFGRMLLHRELEQEFVKMCGFEEE
ncbi:glutamate synthase-related protein [Methermicoccus shengliensis]|uniref:glutamate synthase (NADPH) n=1 Tax=Methermicoccus shengliensis TaxID=660064 RepID=A0A832VNE6_9EURY|nr:4Fe-4S dicluster domain-containing protein [Methermicoccus shengliensis]KUK04315.1 MAG: Glutamate synthase family protein [Euryarchaeota archaeon 55_53]KUK30658.1 MAG: Glutamate synthase family protein [Methanosarcinales archeaon 56_1174]MDI3488207.1 hypothetical protein [Methanosarcinales archaeon]MDN5295482.1 hypothetical protein [Methanosarcinales archaeon]HIH70246.1 4Fe-4S dicluster domain-containing protein [Methermicoccus shengliensis]